MKRILGHKIGDTLIEVTLAIGIFSLVAITVVSVISGSTSDAQANLETTVTREAIDTQSEALRFIQSAYISGSDIDASDDNKFAAIWKEIVDMAEDPNDKNTQYNVDTCSEIYENNNNYLTARHAFIIDTNQLYNTEDKDFALKIVKKADNSSNFFRPATTYPRLYYSTIANSDDDALLNNAGQTLTAAEGIFIVPVKGNDTKIFDGQTTESKTAYYDFYIRTCWYNPGADNPSTISTVARLYDPSVMPTTNIKPIEVDHTANTSITITYVDDTKFLGRRSCIKNRDCMINQYYAKIGYTFNGWSLSPSCNSVIQNKQAAKFSSDTKLYACLSPKMHTITFDPNGGTGSMSGQQVLDNIYVNLNMNNFAPPYNGYTFLYWTTNTGAKYFNGSRIKATGDITLYAHWGAQYTMQTFNNGLCKNLASASDYNVVDSRNNKRYTVRYLNGKCWMTSNLKIKGTADNPLKAAGSNFTGAYFNINTGSGFYHKNQVVASLNDIEYYSQFWTKPVSTGSTYNFCAAVAGTGNGCYCKDVKTEWKTFDFDDGSVSNYFHNCIDSVNYNGDEDICPENWHIPSTYEEFDGAFKTGNLFPVLPPKNEKGESTKWTYWTKEYATAYGVKVNRGGEVDKDNRRLAGISSGRKMYVFAVTSEGKKSPDKKDSTESSYARLLYARIRCVRKN